MTRLPKADGLLLVTGSRTAALADKISEVAGSFLELIEVPNHTSDRDIPCPDTLLICDERGLDSGDLAKHLGITYVPCLATQLAGRIAPVEPGPEAAPPARGMPLERFEISSKTFASVDTAASEGLYRLERADHKRPYQIFRGGNWYQTSYEEGVFLELAHDPAGEKDHVRWKPEDDGQRDDMGQLIVDWGTPLPPAQGRLATLCSGLTPVFAEVTGAGGFTKYDNVPYSVATTIARSVHQSLKVF
ncbi:hypothetical protein ACGFI3_34625 [Nonomuraea wenchangensis]|uniref:hypothetical protein n=1 Tax=Nonomuraea wenchangensis TaxID=568860 RepID=UPI0037226351